MKKIYNVSVELKELNTVRHFNYIIAANCLMHAMDKVFDEIYKDDDNYNREIISIHLNKLDISK